MRRRNLPAIAAHETFRPGPLWPVWVVLITCVWIAFSASLSNGFVDWDDHEWIVENHAFRGLGWAPLRFAFTSFTGGVYQPLGWLLQNLVYERFGLNPYAYHRVSLAFHALNVVLLHLLCVRLMTRAMPETVSRLKGSLGWICGLPVLLYAVHPLRVEPVAWASCQAYLPGVTFSLFATLAYLRAHPSSGVFQPRWMITASILVVLGVLFKGSSVVLPVVFLILDASMLARPGADRLIWPTLRKLLLEKGPILAFCLTFTVVAFAAKRSRVEPEETAHSVLVARVAQASFGACFYLAKTVWPFGITAFYPRPQRGDYQSPLFMACFAAVMFTMIVAFWQRKKRPWLLAVLASYLVIVSPYLGLARVGIPLASDRYSYAPMMAWVVLGCVALCKLADRPILPRVWASAGTLAVGLILGLMTLCSAQCHVWDSSEHLWTQALEHAEWSSELHHFLGASLADDGKLKRATDELVEALRLRPHYFEATYDLGVALDRRGETDAAVTSLREAERLRPNDSRVALSLGGALVHQGHFEEAVSLYRDALRRHPNYPNLHFNLGVALLRQRKVDEAIDTLNRAVGLRPWYTEAYTTLGGAYILKGQLDSAAVQYRAALRLDPDHTASRINLGLALARQGHSLDAISELREAIQRDPQNPEPHHILGAIFLDSGHPSEASSEFEVALLLSPDHRQARALLATARARRF